MNNISLDEMNQVLKYTVEWKPNMNLSHQFQKFVWMRNNNEKKKMLIGS